LRQKKESLSSILCLRENPLAEAYPLGLLFPSIILSTPPYRGVRQIIGNSAVNMPLASPLFSALDEDLVLVVIVAESRWRAALALFENAVEVRDVVEARIVADFDD